MRIVVVVVSNILFIIVYSVRQLGGIFPPIWRFFTATVKNFLAVRFMALPIPRAFLKWTSIS